MLFHRSEYTKVPLEPFGIVVLNEILNHSNQAGHVGEAFSVIPFPLQNSPESFHWSVINAFGYSGHTLGNDRDSPYRSFFKAVGNERERKGQSLSFHHLLPPTSYLLPDL